MTDNSAIELIDVMEVALVFVEEAYNTPDRLKSLEETITKLLKEIGDCSTFVRQCVNMQGRFLGLTVCASVLLSMSLLGRTVEQSLKNARTIDNFKMKFKELHDRLNTATMFQVLHTGKCIF